MQPRHQSAKPLTGRNASSHSSLKPQAKSILIVHGIMHSLEAIDMALPGVARGIWLIGASTGVTVEKNASIQVMKRSLNINIYV